MLLAALLATGAVAADAPVDRYSPVPETTLTLTHERMRPSQGGQRVRVTIPMTPGTNASGDTFVYAWDTSVSGGSRCQPGALPDLSGVTAGTVIEAVLPKPAKGWCRGLYGVTLNAVVVVNGDHDPEPYCRPGEPNIQAYWSVYADVDSVVGPDRSSSDIDAFFERVFRDHPRLRDRFEIDDVTFYGHPRNRADAIRMAEIVDGVLSRAVTAD